MLEPLLPLLLGGVGLGIGLFRRRRRLQAWQDAAAACGLENIGVSGWSRQLTARAGPLDVGIETCGNKGRYTRIVLRVPWPPHVRDVSIRREPLLRWAQEIEIGESSFDSTFLLKGPRRLVLALLDAETRRLLIDVNSRVEIATGTLQAEDMSDEKVPYVLPRLLDLARRLAQPVDVVRRLADNANRDPEVGVRLQNLLLLIRELPEAPETLEALRTACSDQSPGMRLQAAKGLGAEGRSVLLDLAESLVDDVVSAEAVATLDRELSLERTQTILDRALDRRLPRTARACLEALGKSGDAAAAEPSLIHALQREEADLRVAAANALGRVGSAAAVLPLEEAAERSWLDRELHQAARQAITEIQSRLPGASPGQLSLARTEVGQLSLAQAETGHLSIAVDPAGQISLPSEEPEQRPQKAREEPAGRPV